MVADFLSPSVRLLDTPERLTELQEADAARNAPPPTPPVAVPVPT